jgi:hypothetical protein
MEQRKNKKAAKKQAHKRQHIFFNPFNYAEVALPSEWGE